MNLQLSEAVNLHQDLLELEASIDQAKVPSLSINAQALIYTARITLYDLYACNEALYVRFGGIGVGHETIMQQISQDGVTEMTKSIFVLVLEIRRLVTTDPDSVSPFVIHGIFQAMRKFAWYKRLGDDPSAESALGTMMDVLRMLNKRWRVCGKFLSIVAWHKMFSWH